VTELFIELETVSSYSGMCAINVEHRWLIICAYRLRHLGRK